MSKSQPLYYHGALLARLPPGITDVEDLEPEEKDRLRALMGTLNQWHKEGKTDNAYDSRVAQWQFSAPKRLAEAVLPMLAPGCEVLDLGAGTGKVGEYLIEDGHIVDGIDFSKELLKGATQRGYRHSICAALELENIRDLLPEDANYKAIVSVGAYGDHVSQIWIPEALKCLKSGIVAIAGCSEGFKEKGEFSLRETLENEGLEIMKAFSEVSYLFPSGDQVEPGEFSFSFKPIRYDYVVAVR